MCDTLLILDDTDDDALRRQLIGRIMPRGDYVSIADKQIFRLLPILIHSEGEGPSHLGWRGEEEAHGHHGRSDRRVLSSGWRIRLCSTEEFDEIDRRLRVLQTLIQEK